MTTVKDENLAEIGFKDFAEYQSSFLWGTIQKHILDRDAGFCRSKYCRSNADVAVHLAYTVPILLGKSPHCLVSVCNSCRDKIVMDEKGNTRSLEKSLSQTLIMLTGTHLVKGVSNPYIGKWFKNQYNANQGVKLKLSASLKELNLNV